MPRSEVERVERTLRAEIRASESRHQAELNRLRYELTTQAERATFRAEMARQHRILVFMCVLLNVVWIVWLFEMVPRILHR